MAFEKRDNSGSAFKNRRKSEPNHADYTGEGLIEGQEFWINVWVKKDKNGNPWFSYSFRKKQARQEGAAQSNNSQPTNSVELDDDLPF